MLLFRIKKIPFSPPLLKMRERKAPVAACRPHTRHSPWPSAAQRGQPGEQLQPLLGPAQCEHGVRQPLPDHHQQLRRPGPLCPEPGGWPAGRSMDKRSDFVLLLPLAGSQFSEWLAPSCPWGSASEVTPIILFYFCLFT